MKTTTKQTNKQNKNKIIIIKIILTMYSFVCYFSKLEQIAHCKAKNQNHS